MPPKRRNKRRDDSDDDPLADQLSHLKLLEAQNAAESDDDKPQKADKETKPAASRAAKKKDKKQQRGGRRDDSDNDVDPLAHLKALEQEESDEDIPQPVMTAKNKKNKGKTAVITAAAVLASDSSEEEEEVKPAKSSKKSKSKSKKDIAVLASDSSEEEEEVKPAKSSKKSKSKEPEPTSDEEDVGKSKKSKSKSKSAEVEISEKKEKKSKDKKSKHVEKEETDEVPAEPVMTTSNLPPPPAAAAPAISAPEPTPEPVPEPAAEPTKKVKKTKLQLKLEAAQKEREAALKKQQEEAAAAAAIEAAKPPPPPEPIETPALVEVIEEKQPAATVAKTVYQAEDLNEEAAQAATLFGDEVVSEYGPSPVATTTNTDKKLSNKAKRKLAKEAEAKEREEEYNRVALQRSIEGAQFAVSQSAVDVNDPQWQNALDITIPNFSISAHNKELFVNAECNIIHGRRYGLVGPNGAGKSTLLKMIATGELKLPPRVDYLYVEQEVMADDTRAVDAVLKADKERWTLLQEEKQLLAELAAGPDEKKDVRLGEVYEQLSQIGAAAAESKARRILFGLGFTEEMQIRPTRLFSGGWRMRISLARALFMEPTLLMLDEPTNHLDLNAVIWLDDYLQKWKKTLLIVSHDQDFLNSVCQDIIHLEDKKLVYYRGNYDTFKEQEAVRRKQLQKAWEQQEKRIRELKSKGQTTQTAQKNVMKAKSREPGARASKKAEAAAAASGIESAESKTELIKRPREYQVKFTFPEVPIISPPILEVRDVNFRYGPGLPWLFRNLNFGMDMDSRVCIVGPNGSGKSTIIKLITQEVEPPEGEVRRNPRLRVGVYNQHFVDRLPMDEDPVTYLRRLFNNETYQSCRNMLGRYGLEGHAHTIPIRDLSGGQKARVVFVELSLMAPHLLFLDEPTNNLDIESIDALCDALRAFNGGVVLVSHDARLIETTSCQLWVVEDQNVTPWHSGFAAYREHLLQKLEEQFAAIVPGSGERPK